MSRPEMDPVFTATLRARLVEHVRSAPRRRHWRRRLGVGVAVGTVAIAGGVAVASAILSVPGGTATTPLGTVVSLTRTGSATIDLGAPPSSATDVAMTLTCLSAGTFFFPDGASERCSVEDLRRPALFRQALEYVALHPGERRFRIRTGAHDSWSLQALYVRRAPRPWAHNASGETYGAPNANGTPDLVPVLVDRGARVGYIKTSDERCASGEDEVHTPAEALAWDRASRDRNVSIPVYESDGTTVIGSFLVGDASGPDARTVPVASLAAQCHAR